MTELPLNAPAERNKQPILEILERTLPAEGIVLEIASGTGQHIVHFAAALPRLSWQPSEADATLREVIAARIAEHRLGNVRRPLALDVTEPAWPLAAADAIVCINMIHIAPWRASQALFRGAGELISRAGAPLILYGPYKCAGAHTASSNAAFDASLKARNPEWGVRDLEAVVAEAGTHGFALAGVVAMPANNFVVILRRE